MRVLCRHFSQLTVEELYDLLQLRELVFQVEQKCIYIDLDDKDKLAYHLMIYEDNILAAYARILERKISYPDYPSIGRVVSHPNKRKSGYGKKIMKEAIKKCAELFPDEKRIKISAQSYLKSFYNELGFQSVGEEYLEDAIPHIAMIRDSISES